VLHFLLHQQQSIDNLAAKYNLASEQHLKRENNNVKIRNKKNPTKQKLAHNCTWQRQQISSRTWKDESTCRTARHEKHSLACGMARLMYTACNNSVPDSTCNNIMYERRQRQRTIPPRHVHVQQVFGAPMLVLNPCETATTQTFSQASREKG